MGNRLFQLIEPKTNLESERKIFSDANLMQITVPLFFEQLLTMMVGIADTLNTHRSAFAGRNFEYYSEDGYLSGELAREQVKACDDTGVYSYIKHFALNDQETNRNGILCTWTTEQAMRQATKNVFYTTVNSAAYENYIPSAIPGWQMTSYIIEGVVVALLVVAEVLLVCGYMKKKGG